MKYYKWVTLYRHIFMSISVMLVLTFASNHLLAQQASADSESSVSTEANDPSNTLDDTETQEESSNSFEFSGDYTSVVFAEDNERTVLRGNAQIISKTTQLFSDSIEVFGTDFRYASSIGNVIVVDTEQNYRLSAQELWFDREDEILRARGQAVLEDYDNELVIKGEIIEFRNKEQLSEIQRGVRILGEDIIARSEYVRYSRDTEVVEFSGLPVVEWKEDEYSAARIILDMDDDTVELQGQVYGKIQVDDDGEEDHEEESTEDQEEIENDLTTVEEQEGEPQPVTDEETNAEADTETEQEPVAGEERIDSIESNEENQQDSSADDEAIDDGEEGEQEPSEDQEEIENELTTVEEQEGELQSVTDEETNAEADTETEQEPVAGEERIDSIESNEENQQDSSADDEAIDDGEEGEQEPAEDQEEIENEVITDDEQEDELQPTTEGEANTEATTETEQEPADGEEPIDGVENDEKNQQDSSASDEAIDDSGEIDLERVGDGESVESEIPPSNLSPLETPTANDESATIDSIDGDTDIKQQQNSEQLLDTEEKTDIEEKTHNTIIEDTIELETTPAIPTEREESHSTPSVNTTDRDSVNLTTESQHNNFNTDLPSLGSSSEELNISDPFLNENDKTR